MKRWIACLIATAALLLSGCGDDPPADSCPADCPERFCQEDLTCSAEKCPTEGCVDGQYCDAEFDRCLPGCKTDEVCGDDQVCDPETRECTPCTAALACVQGVCLESEGRCVKCASDVDCGFGTATYCQPATNDCVAGCLAPQNCPSSLQCNAQTQRCVGCRQDSDCNGLKCIESGDENFCAECLQDPGCGVGTGEYCDTSSFACRPGCVDDISCPEGQSCNAAIRTCE